MESSSSANTALICIKAWLIGSMSPFRQSIVMLPRISRRRCLALMMLMISHNCCVLLLKRETSQHMMVSPGWEISRSISRFSLTLASPCSRSVIISSAPAAFNSRTWRFKSCPFSSAREQRAYPYFLFIFPFSCNGKPHLNFLDGFRGFRRGFRLFYAGCKVYRITSVYFASPLTARRLAYDD